MSPKICNNVKQNYHYFLLYHYFTKLKGIYKFLFITFVNARRHYVRCKDIQMRSRGKR